MKSGIDIYICLIALTILALVGGSFIAADANVLKARDAQAAYVAEIENSDFSESTINKCIENAASMGYQLDVIKLGNGVDGHQYAQVSLTYAYKIPILGVNSNHTITSYAR